VARAYISSSYIDLIEERRVVQDVLVSRAHTPVGMEQYRANPLPPLDVCVGDVEGCSHYFGIFAFRYGSCPNGSDICITEHEYRAAMRKGIPTYIFLLRENAAWPVEKIDKDRSNVDRLRAELMRSHVVKQFSSKEELALLVKDVVDLDLPQARQFDPLLPYHCNRSQQRDSLADAIAGSARRTTRPTLLFIHGDDEQEHDTFQQRLATDLLPAELRAGAVRPKIKSYHVQWPGKAGSDSQFRTPYLRETAEKIVGDRSASLEQVRDTLSRFPVPVMIYSYFRGEADELQLFVNFWRTCPDLEASGQRVLAVVFVQYPRLGKGWLDRWRDAAGPIRRAVEERHAPQNDTPTWVLPTLDDISLGEAEDWARTDQVSREWDSLAILDGIRAYYGAHFGKDYQRGKLSMKKLASHLKILLANSSALAGAARGEK
jgi:hypothetical protein